MTSENAIEEARALWIAERSDFEAFASSLKLMLEDTVRNLGIYADISARTKEVHSLVKKLLAKPIYDYKTLPDKVGVRIVVRYRSELPLVVEAISSVFELSATDDKSQKLGVDRLGYQSIHADGLHLRSDSRLIAQFPADRFFAELQVRTLAQHLWAEMSHDAFYKNEALIASLSADVQRRVNLMGGLVEVADREFDDMSRELPSQPEAKLLRELEKLFYQLTAHRANVELSLEVIHLLLPLYAGKSEAEIMEAHVVPTFIRSKKMLQCVYSNPDDYTEVSAFLFQPEALLIYDCLQTDPDATLSKWNHNFPPKELARVATAFGLSIY